MRYLLLRAGSTPQIFLAQLLEPIGDGGGKEIVTHDMQRNAINHRFYQSTPKSYPQGVKNFGFQPTS